MRAPNRPPGRPLKRIVGAALAVSVLVGAVAPVASGGQLPAQEGIWEYKNKRGTIRLGLFQAQVRVVPGDTAIEYLTVGSILATCKRQGRRQPGYLTLESSREIPVKADGSFSATRRASATTTKGKLKVKGVFKGTTVSGRVTATSSDKYPGNPGKCKGKAKFKAKGKLVL